jgi:ribose transport system permease protein
MKEQMTTEGRSVSGVAAATKDQTPEPADLIRRRGAGDILRGLFGGSEESGIAAKYSLIAIWLLLIVLFAITVGHDFLTSSTLTTILGGQQALVFLAMAAVITLTVGELDLSIAAQLGLAATLVPVMVTYHHWDPATAAVLAIAAASLAGAVNAVIIVVIGIDPIVVTLGMATLLTGLASKFSGNGDVGGLSDSFAKLSNTNIIGLPITFFYGVALVLAIAFVLRLTPLGRHMSFVGANHEVARLASVRVRRIRMGAYITSAFICGLGGVLLSAGLGGFDSSTSANYLLPALSAAFLGTAAIRPGKFNPIGTFIAIYFLATGIVGLELLGASGWISDVFYGGALVVAIVAATITRRRTLTAG